MSHHRAKRSSDSARAPSAPAFPTNKEAPDLPSKTRIFCDILASRADDDVDAALDKADIRGVTTADVEQVLRLSYAHPCAATAFFHWAGNRHLGHEHHSPYSWNLVVDILGTNCLFARMWDTVESMHSRRLLSLDTFASVFSSLAASPGCSSLEAFMDMPRYGMTQDTQALNSLLSALCRADRLYDARAEAGTRPDADSYAILLEGCEAAADRRAARDVFDEMVRDIGFDPDNVPAYDAFLTTLVSSDSSTALPEAMYYLDFLNRHGCSPGAGERFFHAALGAHLEAGELHGATCLWARFVGRGGLVPDVEMYNTMIMLQGTLGHAEVIVDYLDDMIFNGVFPGTYTYNVVLQLLLEGRELHKAAAIFSEMTGIKVWSCVVENGLPPLEECGNMLVSKLKDVRLPEACKYAEDMVDRGIKLSLSTLSKLKRCLQKIKKGDIYDHLLRKWKAH
ncbi:unnamed protein product [Miscanthus lutarioriparius]|uniref:Pentatricopeptide repeat-containing protein n=1 Tax=Miscanthus lutarioriparius TaxID=422564 RepID=A0A811Q291_9POAL|nr:unnamed protein product [Miscanthus lutarioriparius]